MLRIWPVEPFVTRRQAARWRSTAQVRNFGRQRATHQLVELFVDGRRIEAIDRRRRAKGRNARCRLPIASTGAGRPRRRSCGSAGDALDIDNHRWLSLSVKEYSARAVRRRQARPDGGFRCHRLPGRRFRTRRGRRPAAASSSAEVVPESARCWKPTLPRYDCVFLCNIGQFTANEARVLDGLFEATGAA